MKKDTAKNKIITLLVPVYNTEKYIRRCLDSVLINEINDKIEILVVSDGSRDGSVEIVQDYVARYPGTVRLVEKENGGHGSTINKGIELASGKYFRVLDSDDWFDISSFKKFVELLEHTDCDLVISDYTEEFIYEHREEAHKYDHLIPGKVYCFDKMKFSEFQGEYFTLATSTYKTDVLRESGVRLDERTFYVDMEYNLEAIAGVDAFIYYDLNVYRYYIGRPEQSISIESTVRHKMDHDKVTRSMVEYYEMQRNKVSEVKLRYMRMMTQYMIHTHYTIFCTYDRDKKDAKEKIQAFDRFLKDSSPELFEVSQSDFYIRLFRWNKFKLVGSWRGLINIAYFSFRKMRDSFRGL